MATRVQVRAFAKHLPEAYLRCRQYGHNWDPFSAVKTGPRYDVTLDCERCHSKRRILLDSNGMLVKAPHTNYAEGYLAHGIGRLTGEAKGVIRLEGVRRILAAADAAQTTGAEVHGPVTSRKRRQKRSRSVKEPA